MKKTLAVIMVLLIGMISAQPAFSSFEQQLTGARSLGLGGAFVALADTSEAVFYNPAGLTQIARPEFMATYSDLYIGLTDGSSLTNSNLVGAYPLGLRGNNGVLGFGYNQFSLQGYYGESTMGLYYGRKINKIVSLGIGIKQLGISYGTDQYTALNPVFANGTSKTQMSADLGILVFPLKKLSLGFSIRDINSPDMGLEYTDQVNQTATVGAAYRAGTLNLVSDFSMQGDNYLAVAGAEKWFGHHQFAVRGAFGIGSEQYSRVSVGISWEGKHLFADYGFYYPLSGIVGTVGTHQMSVGFRFGKNETETKVEADRLYREALSDIGRGEYSKAHSLVKDALDLVGENESCEALKSGLEYVMGYIKDSCGTGRVDHALSAAMTKYLAEGEDKKAVELVWYAYSLDPDRQDVEKLGRAMAAKYNVELEETAKTWNLAEQKVFQALNCVKDKRYDEAIKLCEEALELEPGNVTAYKRMGSIFFLMGDYERAKKNWEKAIETAPNDEEVPNIKKLIDQIHTVASSK